MDIRQVIKRFFRPLLIVTLIAATLFSTAVFAAPIIPNSHYSVTEAISTTYTVSSSTSWSALGLPPTVTDTVVVNQNATLTVDVPNAVAAAVQLGGTTASGNNNSGTLSFNSGSILTVSGPVTLGNNGKQASSRYGVVNMTGGGTLVARSLVVISKYSSWTAGTGTVQLTGTNSLPSRTITQFNNLSIISGTTSLGTNTTVTGNLSISDGAGLTVGGNSLTVSGNATVGDGASGLLSITSGRDSDIFAGLVTVNAGGTWNDSGNARITFKGGITNNGTFNAGSGLQTFNTNDQAITGNLYMPNVTVAGVTLTNNNSLTASSLAGSGGLTQAVGATLNIRQAANITTLNATATGNTVNYNGAYAQTVKTVPYFNLALSGSGVKTMTGVTTITGDLTLSGAASTATAANLAVSGNLTINTGTILTVGANYTLTVGGNTTVGGTYADNSAGAKTFSGDVLISGVWNEAAAAAYDFGGSFINNAATFTANTGTHTFSGSSQTIGGTNTTAIPGVDVEGYYTNTGILNAATLLIVNGNLTNNGTVTTATTLAGTGGLTQGPGSFLNIGGTNSITTLTATAAGNTVNYNGVAQTVASIEYYNLTLSGSGTKNLASLGAIDGNLSLNNGVVANLTEDIEANNLTIGGAGKSAGTWGTTASGAEYPDDINFAGTGMLTVAEGAAAPYVIAAATSPDGNTITITFDKTISDPNTFVSDFTYKVNGGAALTLSSATLIPIVNTDDSIRLTTASSGTISPGNTVTISYGGGTHVTSSDGGVLANFNDYLVTNNMPTPPILTYASTTADGNTITITFDKPMSDPGTYYGDFTYKINGSSTAQTFSGAALDTVITANDSISLTTTTSGTISSGDTITVCFGGNPHVISSDGGVLDNFIDLPVNNSVPPPPVTVSGAVTDTTGSTIIITFSKAMNDPAGWASSTLSEFSYSNNGNPGTFTSGTLDVADNTKIDFATSDTIATGDVVNVSYTGTDVTAADGGILSNFSGQTVTNNSTSPTAPTVVSAVASSYQLITITFSKPMNDPSSALAGFTYADNDTSDLTFNNVAIETDATRIDFGTSTNLAAGDTITVSYSSSPAVTSTDGGMLANFTNQSVINNIPSAPVITQISPTSGPTSGSTSITITGSGFYAGGETPAVTAVQFGNLSATSYTVTTDSQITATSPAGSAGVVDVTVTTLGGTSATSSTDQFTYNVDTTTTTTTTTTQPPSGGGGGPSNSTFNVNGFGSQTQLTIGPDGVIQNAVTFRTSDGRVTVDIKAGTKALGSDGKPITNLGMQVIPNPPTAPSGEYDMLGVTFQPSGATFNPPLVLTVTYDPGALAAKGISEDNLAIGFYDDSVNPPVWTIYHVPDITVDTINHTVTFNIKHFSTYALIGVLTETTTTQPAVTTTKPAVTTTPATISTPPVTTPVSTSVITSSVKTTVPPVPPSSTNIISTTSPLPATSSSTGATVNWIWPVVWSLLGLVIILGLFWLFLLRRRKNNKEGES